MIISQESLRIVKDTAGIVKDNAIAITSTFYPMMLGRHPELYNYFNEANQLPHSPCPGIKLSSSGAGQQSKTLADAIVAYALNIEHLENLSELVTRMCHKHVALGIKPEHYQIVHDCLMEAIGEVLGNAVTPDIAAAWSEAVLALAKICIKTETDLYRDAAEVQWTGTREFRISDIIQEAEDIVSIRFVPTDGKGTCPFEPGQYITVFEKPHGKMYFAPRHYTVTSQPGERFYQITVKRMKTGDHKGAMSHFLHKMVVGDLIMVGPVFGPAPLQQHASAGRSAVFVSAGVGITPTISMLAKAIDSCKDVFVFHADRSAESMAFGKNLEDAVEHGKISCLDLSFSEESTEISPNQTSGRLSSDKIVSVLKARGCQYKDGADYFVCAGASTTPLIYKGLVRAGVNSSRIHMEYFSPFVTVELDEKPQ